MVSFLNSYQIMLIQNRQEINNIYQKYIRIALIYYIINPDAKEIKALIKPNLIINICTYDICFLSFILIYDYL